MPQTLEQAQADRLKAVESNRALDVVEYKSGEEQSDKIFEVVEGYKHLPGGIRLGPGQRFHPTVKQVRTGALKGKARELTRDEHRSMTGKVFPGADVGIRALPMAKTNMEMAIKAGLKESDFEGVEPGLEGRYTRSQVQKIIDAKSAEGDAEKATAPLADE